MYAKVIIDQDAKALDKVFEYIIPEGLDVNLGDRVYVPFSSRILQGFVVDVSNTCEYDEKKLKKIISKVDQFSVIKPEMIELMNFMAEKNHLKLASILRLFIPAEMREGKVKELFQTYFTLTDKEIVLSKSAKKQQEIVDFMKEKKRCLSSELVKKFGVSAVKSLTDKGVLLKEKIEIKREPFVILGENSPKNLNFSQKNALNLINNEKTYLLHGVTGSGKTEVYMRLIERVLKENKNAIMLVPEISLTPQIMSNFKSRFGDNVALLHSGLSAGERFDEWRRLYSGANIALLAPIAIFA